MLVSMTAPRWRAKTPGRGKPFNPNPRGPYDNADHGYRSQFGDKHEYREAYSAAYRNGYFSVRGRGYDR